MHADLVDVVLVVLAVAYAVRGFRRGLLVGAASIIGIVAGALLGTRLSPVIVHALASHAAPVTDTVVAVLVVVVTVIVVQEVLVAIAVGLRGQLPGTPLRQVDALGGAALSVVGLAVVAWVLGLVVARSPFGQAEYEVRHSQILQAIDGVMPASSYAAFASLLRLVQQHDLPPLFFGLGPSRIVPAAPAPPTAVPAGVLRAVAPSVVKITADEPSCSRGSEGSGFVYAPSHVVTNAHVVAGATSVRVVQDGTGTPINLPARVVLYDPHRDVAVLDVPGLSRPALGFSGGGAAGDVGDVVGYPENGGFTVDPARITTRMSATGPDIYDNATVTRDVYQLRALVRPGNSGGPLVAPSGAVYGIVFAAATDTSDTGYALTAAEAGADARAGADATTPVSTQGCD